MRVQAVAGSAMEREANYVAVGAFILLVMAMAVAFVLWYTDANDQRDYDVYEIYFTGSVSGLMSQPWARCTTSAIGCPGPMASRSGGGPGLISAGTGLTDSSGGT